MPSFMRELTFHTRSIDRRRRRPSRSRSSRPRAGLSTVHTDTLYAAALAGMGITGLPSFVAEEALLENALERRAAVLAPAQHHDLRRHADAQARAGAHPRLRRLPGRRPSAARTAIPGSWPRAARPSPRRRWRRRPAGRSAGAGAFASARPAQAIGATGGGRRLALLEHAHRAVRADAAVEAGRRSSAMAIRLAGKTWSVPSSPRKPTRCQSSSTGARGRWK